MTAANAVVSVLVSSVAKGAAIRSRVPNRLRRSHPVNLVLHLLNNQQSQRLQQDQVQPRKVQVKLANHVPNAVVGVVAVNVVNANHVKRKLKFNRHKTLLPIARLNKPGR